MSSPAVIGTSVLVPTTTTSVITIGYNTSALNVLSNSIFNLNVSISGNIYNTGYNNNFNNINTNLTNLTNSVNTLSGKLYNYAPNYTTNNILCATPSTTSNLFTNSTNYIVIGQASSTVYFPGPVIIQGTNTLNVQNIQPNTATGNVNLYSNTTGGTVSFTGTGSNLNIGGATTFNNNVTLNGGLFLGNYPFVTGIPVYYQYVSSGSATFGMNTTVYSLAVGEMGVFLATYANDTIMFSMCNVGSSIYTSGLILKYNTGASNYGILTYYSASYIYCQFNGFATYFKVIRLS
jgi:hypothetical protein